MRKGNEIEVKKKKKERERKWQRVQRREESRANMQRNKGGEDKGG